jgi:hypothetical protein
MGYSKHEGERELRRIEYDGYLLIEYERPSALSVPWYRTFKEWDLYRIQPDGGHSFLGSESTEYDAKHTVDYLNGKFALKPPGYNPPSAH